MIVTCLLKTVIYGDIFMRSRAVSHDRNEPTNQLSDYVPLHGGVPQGIKLGSIGFQILINEAAKNSSSKSWKYVDDLTFAENSTCAHFPSRLI